MPGLTRRIFVISPEGRDEIFWERKTGSGRWVGFASATQFATAAEADPEWERIAFMPGQKFVPRIRAFDVTEVGFVSTLFKLGHTVCRKTDPRGERHGLVVDVLSATGTVLVDWGGRAGRAYVGMDELRRTLPKEEKR